MKPSGSGSVFHGQVMFDHNKFNYFPIKCKYRQTINEETERSQASRPEGTIESFLNHNTDLRQSNDFDFAFLLKWYCHLCLSHKQPDTLNKTWFKFSASRRCFKSHITIFVHQFYSLSTSSTGRATFNMQEHDNKLIIEAYYSVS